MKYSQQHVICTVNMFYSVAPCLTCRVWFQSTLKISYLIRVLVVGFSSLVTHTQTFPPGLGWSQVYTILDGSELVLHDGLQATKQLSILFSVVSYWNGVSVAFFRVVNLRRISDFHETGSEPFRLVAAHVGSWRDGLHCHRSVVADNKGFSFHCLELIQCLS